MPRVAAHAQDEFASRSRKRHPSPDIVIRRKRSKLPWIGLCLGSGAAIAAVAVHSRGLEPALSGSLDAPVVDAAFVRAPPPVWEPIVQPTALFAVETPENLGLPALYEARAAGDEAREDILTFGTHDANARPFARLAIQQASRPQEAGSSFFVDIARLAADAGLAVTRSAPASGLPTKFGVADIGDVTLAGSAERACLGLRFSHPETAFRLGAWLCGSRGQPPTRRQLACLVDGLSLRADDPALKALFADAERQRDRTCTPPARVAAAKAAPPREARRR